MAETNHDLINSCDMPTPTTRDEATVYRHIRDTLVAAHCADKRPSHRCCGAITIDRATITFACPRCGDARKTIVEN